MSNPISLGTEGFISAEGIGLPRGYITVEDVRRRGITQERISDEELQELILLMQVFIEKVTGQFFEQRQLSFSFDGSDSDILFLPIPIIEIEELRINDSITPLPKTDYVVYNGRTPPEDDRRNPKIALKQGYRKDIFTGNGLRRFLKGRKNQHIKGTFGFVAADGSTPLPIRNALMKLVMREIPETGSGQAQGFSLGKLRSRIISETTDKHSYTLANTISEGSLTGDKEIDDVLALYRAPITLGAPKEW